jgi:hypothetical protein
METLAVIIFFLLGKAPKEIHTILTETLGEHAPPYASAKNWVAQLGVWVGGGNEISLFQ